MMNDTVECTTYEIAWSDRLRWKTRWLLGIMRAWLLRQLLALVVRLVGDTNMIRHAKMELRASLAQSTESPNRWMANDLVQLLAVLSAQGHSGGSIGWCVASFALLARFKPLGPLTGAADEWNEVGTGVFQNRRCGHVFKQADRFDGQAYDIEARIFREPSGACFTNADSFAPITFPYTPQRVYVDVPAPDAEVRVV